MSVKVTSIQKFCTHDGDGIRTTVFLKGCPLRCAWCHNPETQNSHNEILFVKNRCIGCGLCASVCKNGAHVCDSDGHKILLGNCVSCLNCAKVCPTNAITSAAKEMTVDQIVDEVLKDRSFYGESGGVTLSGGEPLIHPESIEVLKRCKQSGITTAVETCGQFNSDIIPELISVTDTFLFDCKDTNPKRHKQYTGVDNALILKNLRKIDSLGGKIVLRCILVRTVNLNYEHANGLIELVKSLSNAVTIELLPYHAYGGSKSEQLGLGDNGRLDWIPKKQEIEDFKYLLLQAGLTVI